MAFITKNIWQCDLCKKESDTDVFKEGNRSGNAVLTINGVTDHKTPAVPNSWHAPRSIYDEYFICHVCIDDVRKELVNIIQRGEK